MIVPRDVCAVTTTQMLTCGKGFAARHACRWSRSRLGLRPGRLHSASQPPSAKTTALRIRDWLPGQTDQRRPKTLGGDRWHQHRCLQSHRDRTPTTVLGLHCLHDLRSPRFSALRGRERERERGRSRARIRPGRRIPDRDRIRPSHRINLHDLTHPKPAHVVRATESHDFLHRPDRARNAGRSDALQRGPAMDREYGR